MTNFTSDFSREAAGYSPDRCDALVWACSELLVEPMKGWGIFELTRQRAEALAKSKEPPPPPTAEELAKRPETVDDARIRFEIKTRGRKPTANEIAEHEHELFRLHEEARLRELGSEKKKIPEHNIPSENMFDFYKRQATAAAAAKKSLAARNSKGNSSFETEGVSGAEDRVQN